MNDRITHNLRSVYGETAADEVLAALGTRLERFRAEQPDLSKECQRGEQLFSEQDVVLITYGDQIQEPGVAPIRTLNEVLADTVGDVINTVHILPFYPHTSDDGFSVTDYVAVNPTLGSWEDVQHMGVDFRLMFDAVINHISQGSEWFQGYLRDKAPYTGYFINVDPTIDLSQVVRPRTSPLLTPFETASGVRHIWTTFSADQVDLNYADTNLLLEIVDVLLNYVRMGARLIRLDAIGFLWKEIGTSCLHKPQTHHLIRFMRAVLDEVAPGVLLVTETNVPHADNISYFGDGHNEAQMVYNFTLPPLTLYTFQTGDATKLTAWAQTLETPSNETSFFNFMPSHDGVGLRPVEGILNEGEVIALAEQVEAHGGFVSYRANSDGVRSPYELNIVYYDALNDPNSDEDQEVQVARFLCSQAILLSLAGVPGIYVHSLFGSRNWREGVEQTGRNRTINRRKFDREELEHELADTSTVRHQVFNGYRRLLACRIRETAFDPVGGQHVFSGDPALFVLLRTAPDGNSSVLCVHNISGENVSYDITPDSLALSPGAGVVELLTERTWQAGEDGSLSITLPPYGAVWLKSETGN